MCDLSWLIPLEIPQIFGASEPSTGDTKTSKLLITDQSLDDVIGDNSELIPDSLSKAGHIIAFLGKGSPVGSTFFSLIGEIFETLDRVKNNVEAAKQFSKHLKWILDNLVLYAKTEVNTDIKADFEAILENVNYILDDSKKFFANKLLSIIPAMHDSDEAKFNNLVTRLRDEVTKYRTVLQEKANVMLDDIQGGVQTNIVLVKDVRKKLIDLKDDMNSKMQQIKSLLADSKFNIDDFKLEFITMQRDLEQEKERKQRQTNIFSRLKRWDCLCLFWYNYIGPSFDRISIQDFIDKMQQHITDTEPEGISLEVFKARTSFFEGGLTDMSADKVNITISELTWGCRLGLKDNAPLAEAIQFISDFSRTFVMKVIPALPEDVRSADDVEWPTVTNTNISAELTRALATPGITVVRGEGSAGKTLRVLAASRFLAQDVSILWVDLKPYLHKPSKDLRLLLEAIVLSLPMLGKMSVLVNRDEPGEYDSQKFREALRILLSRCSGRITMVFDDVDKVFAPFIVKAFRSSNAAVDGNRINSIVMISQSDVDVEVQSYIKTHAMTPLRAIVQIDALAVTKAEAFARRRGFIGKNFDLLSRVSRCLPGTGISKHMARTLLR